MDQRNFSPLANSSEKPLQTIAPTNPLLEPSEPSLLGLATGLDNAHQNPDVDIKDSVNTEIVKKINPGKRYHLPKSSKVVPRGIQALPRA